MLTGGLRLLAENCCYTFTMATTCCPPHHRSGGGGVLHTCFFQVCNQLPALHGCRLCVCLGAWLLPPATGNTLTVDLKLRQVLQREEKLFSDMHIKSSTCMCIYTYVYLILGAARSNTVHSLTTCLGSVLVQQRSQTPKQHTAPPASPLY